MDSTSDLDDAMNGEEVGFEVATPTSNVVRARPLLAWHHSLDLLQRLPLDLRNCVLPGEA